MQPQKFGLFIVKIDRVFELTDNNLNRLAFRYLAVGNNNSNGTLWYLTQMF